MAVNKENHDEIYRKGLAEGFIVTDAVQHYDYDNYSAGNLEPLLEQLLLTPWDCDGMPVYALAVTNIDYGKERSRGYRDTGNIEFWVYDEEQGSPVNLAALRPDGYRLTDSFGKTITASQAAIETAQFATASSYCFHVFTAREFFETRNYVNGRMGLPKATPKDYKNYLAEIERKMRNENLIAVGKITKPEDMYQAYDTLDDYKG